MAAAVPICCFLLALATLLARHDPRDALLRAAVLWGLLVAASTEVLSLFDAINARILTGFWLGVCVLFAAACWCWRETVTMALSRLRRRPSTRAVAAALPVIVIMVVTALTAVVAPPNSGDAMYYEMARVAHWTDDGSVAHYPTNIIWQLIEPPFAEYAILHMQVLTGGDRLANLVEWFGMVGSVVGVTAVARELGAPVRGQLLAAVVTASMPEGILEATSTFNHYVLTFWLVCSTLFALQFARLPTLETAAFLGASVGLALLTHGTAYLFTVPLLLSVGFWAFFRLRLAALAPALLVLAIALALNFGLFARNQFVFGGPLGPSSNFGRYANAKFTPAVLASNLIRDTAIQFGTPNHRLNVWLTDAIGRVHEKYLKMGVNDPATTWRGTTFEMPYLTVDEFFAGSPLQVAVLGLAMFASVWLVIGRGRTLVALYTACLLGGYFLFALYLKWQPWDVRLELPLLVLGAPLCGAVFGALGGRVMIAALGGALLIASVPWLIDNEDRPLIGSSIPHMLQGQHILPTGQTIFDTPRDDLYFAIRPDLRDSYQDAARQLKGLGCEDVAVRSSLTAWEYPLWPLSDTAGRKIRFQQVFVDNASKSANRFGFRPCALVSIDTVDHPPSFNLDGHEYALRYSGKGIDLYRRSK